MAESSHKDGHMANRVIRRDDVKAMFRPIVPVLEAVIEEARAASSFKVVAKANHEVTRASHLHRLCGAKRWMVAADALVVREPDMADGFGVMSDDVDHNSGKYVFRFPGGVFTIKKQPHKEEEGAYLQEQLEAVLEQAPLADSINAEADLKVFLSIPERLPARLIVTHPALSTRMVIFLDEITSEEAPTTLPSRDTVVTAVRSAVRPEVEEETDTEELP